MLFNSIDFAIFLPIVFILYWFATNRNLKLQNSLLVLASYVFYGWWDWRFLSLIVFSSCIDYFVGIGLGKTEEQKKRKLLLLTSILVNLGFLGFFKYFNFFAESFADAFTLLGNPIEASRLNIILPVGISFYTFQTLSYSIDVYKRKLQPTRDIVSFFTFVSFFPQLVAGPIERAINLLPQFYKERKFSYKQSSDGLKMMLWGLFMKVAVADRLSLYVNEVYGNIENYSSISLIVATVFFAIQIYCDFGGYSLIAIGTAKLFGFNLMTNFKRPYLSLSFKDFWSRWHISLSTWFRDYVYIPLGGSRKGKVRTNTNLLITFIVSGFWHGANWTFIVWGALHSIYQIIEKSLGKIPIPKIFKLLLIFVLTNFAWIFFRAQSINEAFSVIEKIFAMQSFNFDIGDKGIFAFSIMSIIILLANDIALEYFPKVKLFNHKLIIVRYLTILFIVVYIISLGVFDGSQFIYFQF